jgi:hypothetical protein
MTEAIILGTVALKEPGKTLTWDAKTMKIANMPAAEAHLSRKYRKGWKVKGYKG